MLRVGSRTKHSRNSLHGKYTSRYLLFIYFSLPCLLSVRPGLPLVSVAFPLALARIQTGEVPYMIRKLKSGQYRLYSRKKNPKTGRRRNLGTFGSRKAAEAHERAVQYFKRA
jgi:hypothetical protein